MDPVDTLQVGWVVVTVGAAGVAGAGLMMVTVPAEMLPLLFLTVTV
jgi:hypothetical protein